MQTGWVKYENKLSSSTVIKPKIFRLWQEKGTLDSYCGKSKRFYGQLNEKKARSDVYCGSHWNIVND